MKWRIKEDYAGYRVVEAPDILDAIGVAVLHGALIANIKEVTPYIDNELGF